MKKRVLAVLMAMCCCVGLVACGSKKIDVSDIEVEVADKKEDVPTEAVDPNAEFWSQESEDGRVHSILTGEWVEKDVASKRPFACMIENTKPCLPQYFIGQAGCLGSSGCL